MTAVICQYAIQHNPARPAPLPRIVLDAAAAAGLAAIIDNLPPPNPIEEPSCGGELGRYAQLIRFGYAAGPAESAWIIYPGCYPGVTVIAAGRPLVPGPVLGDAFASYAAGIVGGTTARACLICLA